MKIIWVCFYAIVYMSNPSNPWNVQDGIDDGREVIFTNEQECLDTVARGEYYWKRNPLSKDPHFRLDTGCYERKI